MERVDVAIVGGGPAGTAAAWEAAQAGASALVIEKGVPRADREGPGPDSTDAAGLLDYWIDLMGFGPDEIPDDVILRTLDGADFVGPSTSVSINGTGIESNYPAFGLAFHRAKFDDWLREEAEQAGATYRAGDSVTGVETSLDAGHSHTLSLSNGEEIEAEYLILADGPQRTVTIETLNQFTGDRSMASVLDPSTVNHIAYQEHRRVPEDIYDPTRIKFWWGLMPGHTAYPWVFPNDGNVARIGLTMPIGLDIGQFDREHWALLRPEDERIPQGKKYIRRLLEREYPEYDLEEFPLVEDRGKRGGTETYAISSTRPIESPTAAGIAVVGGAMGGTSAFHEGGDHVAVRTGRIAGRLAGRQRLEGYNEAWQNVLGDEFLRNVTMAEVVREYTPGDWDRAFDAADKMFNRGDYSVWGTVRAGLPGLKLLLEYHSTRRGFKNGGYVQFAESEYAI
jgi:electron-transferring-flavoprotein dehydrogenase